MYERTIALTVTYQDITLVCECSVGAVHYDKNTTLEEDVIQHIDAICHKDEDIQDLLSGVAIDEIWSLCYEEYYK